MSKQYPKIITLDDYMKEWDYEINNLKQRDPSKISSHSNYEHVAWICCKCGHKWEATPYSRVQRKTGCPECAKMVRGKRKHKTELKNNGYFNDLILLQDWDDEANYPLTPKDYTPVSNNYAYWKCHVCGYKWPARISNRVHGRGCPACSNKVVHRGFNDLATTHPDLAKEWHPSKNGSLMPTDVTYGQATQIWWLCPECGESYQASLLHRSSGTGCKYCISGRQTSFAEQSIYYYIKKLYPDAINRYTSSFLGKMELDIYIPSINYAIEYDGIAWHGEDKRERETRKYKACKEHNIKLIRFREDETWRPLDDISDYTYPQNNLYEEKNLSVAITWLLSFLDFSKLKYKNIDVNLSRDRVCILEQYKNSEKDNSLAVLYPDIAKEWHPTKNGKLSPFQFKPKSEKMLWWLCPECGNEYQAAPGQRVIGNGCKKCGIKKSALAKSKRVVMCDAITFEPIKEFISISEASRELHINVANIVSVCKGDRKKAGGYVWRYKE